MPGTLSSRQKSAAAVATALAFCALDALWLGFLSRDLYQQTIGAIMQQPPRWDAAIAFYVLYLAGVLHFIVWPVAPRGVVATFIQGALFGLVAYGTYDLTNLATLTAFTWKMTLIDLTWGAFVTGTASAAGAFAARAGRTG